jgi:hypothetical protein
MAPLLVRQFYIRNPFVTGFGIDANTPHLSAEADGSFDDVVQLYAAPGSVSLPHQLENVHVSSNGPADVVVGSPTTIVNNPNINAVNGYELNFADGSFVDVWQQAPGESSAVYASYNGSARVVFSTDADSNTLLDATALADGKIAVLVSSSRGDEEIIIQSKDGSGTPIHLQLANHWSSNPQNGTLSQLAGGDLVVTYAESQAGGLVNLHEEVISEQGIVSHDWTTPTITGIHNPPSETPIIPVAAGNGGGYLALTESSGLGFGGKFFLSLDVTVLASNAQDVSETAQSVVSFSASDPASLPSDIHPAAARLLDGGFVIAWDYQGAIYARNYHFDGSNTTLIADGDAYLASGVHSPFDPPVFDYAPNVAALADGRYAIAWEEVGQNNSYFTSKAAIFDGRTSGVTLKAPDDGANFVGTPFNDTFIGGAGNDTFTPNGGTDYIDGGDGWNTVVYNFASTAANIQHNSNGSWLIFGTGFTDTITNVQVARFTDKAVLLTPIVFTAGMIQAEDFAITRATLPLDQATSIASSINSGTQTEAQFINDLLSQVGDTPIPAVAVEGSMYGAVGTSTEVSLLAAQFLPAQVANAIQNGLNPQVYACEALGLAFAFGNEKNELTFALNYGPHGTMPATFIGDAAFAAAAANAIFGSAATANTPAAILGFVTNWKAFYASNGIPGIQNPSADFIEYAARGAAWGDAVGVALANNLGLLNGQAMNFLEDAVRGTAIYGASLSGQPNHPTFLGAASASTAASENSVQLAGVPGPSDHLVL